MSSLKKQPIFAFLWSCMCIHCKLECIPLPWFKDYLIFESPPILGGSYKIVFTAKSMTKLWQTLELSTFLMQYRHVHTVTLILEKFESCRWTRDFCCVNCLKVQFNIWPWWTDFVNEFVYTLHHFIWGVFEVTELKCWGWILYFSWCGHNLE